MKAVTIISIPLIAVASLVSQLGCDHLSETIPIKGGTGPLIPLAVGNHWIMQSSSYDSLGNLTSVSPPDTMVAIASDTIVNGVRWYVRPWLDVLIAYRLSELGVHVRLVSAHDDTTEFLYFRYPANLGDTLGYPDVWFNGTKPKYYSSSSSMSRLTSLDTIVSVPAGTFRCVRYRVARHGEPIGTDYYFAAGYGWIRKDMWSITPLGRRIFIVARDEATAIILN
jgi:hypothetical protein